MEYYRRENTTVLFMDIPIAHLEHWTTAQAMVDRLNNLERTLAKERVNAPVPTVRGKPVRAVALGEAVAIWMADQVPPHLRDDTTTDPVAIVDKAIERIRAQRRAQQQQTQANDKVGLATDDPKDTHIAWLNQLIMDLVNAREDSLRARREAEEDARTLAQAFHDNFVLPRNDTLWAVIQRSLARPVLSEPVPKPDEKE